MDKIKYEAFYDSFLIIELNRELPPKQRKAKEKNRDFEKEFQGELLKIQKGGMPWKEDLIVAIKIFGNAQWVENVDVDNISKAVLDGCKEILFEDDRQVYVLICQKSIQKRAKPYAYIMLKKINRSTDFSFVLDEIQK
jgi:Holliday junction resolvase RusA-like endonuclease